ncbi:WD40 repeat domain-containing protein [Streptomyces bobili]|uniref:WD40 repeat domain-containing protein n=1 Tax=Streptomyces bobili TaxID=67280 RepID=UPI0037A659A1
MATGSVAYGTYENIIQNFRGRDFDNMVELWDVMDPDSPKRWALVRGKRPVAFSPRSPLLIAGHGSEFALICDVRDPASPLNLNVKLSEGVDKKKRPSPPTPVSLAFSSDGQLFAAGKGREGMLALWDLTDPRNPMQVSTARHDYRVRAVAFSPSGHLLASGSSDGSVKLWDVRNPRRPVQRTVLSDHRGKIGSLAFSGDGRLLITGSRDGSAILYKLSELKDSQAVPLLQADGTQVGVGQMTVDRSEIARLMREVQQEFDKHPTANTTIYNGPVIHGNADSAQLAWGNNTVHQTQNCSEQITPGFEAIAQAVVRTLEGLSSIGLSEEDQQDAEAAANEVLDEATQSEPDRSKIRRALSALKGALAPAATGLAAGGAVGAQEWARTAIEQLGVPF